MVAYLVKQQERIHVRGQSLRGRKRRASEVRGGGGAVGREGELGHEVCHAEAL